MTFDFGGFTGLQKAESFYKFYFRKRMHQVDARSGLSASRPVRHSNGARVVGPQRRGPQRAERARERGKEERRVSSASAERGVWGGAAAGPMKR